MTDAITSTTAVTAIEPQHSHSRKPTFGALVSAIRRGDIEAANTAFDGLQQLAPDLPGWSRKGPLDALGNALKGGKIDDVRTALKEFQQLAGNAAQDQPVAQAKTLKLGTTFEILA